MRVSLPAFLPFSRAPSLPRLLPTPPLPILSWLRAAPARPRPALRREGGGSEAGFTAAALRRGGAPGGRRAWRQRWEAGRQADGLAGGRRRPCSLVRAGGSESLSVCEGGKERASEQPAPSARSTSQAPPPPRAQAGPSRTELGRARAMLLTVYCVRRDLSEVTFSLQVDADFELHNFRALCELESGIPAAESQVRRAASGAAPELALPASGPRALPCCG